MLTNRQLLILQLIIQIYTETLEPVGSKRLLQIAELPFSSATIRNEMSKLEELGYLEKNHTSSGRIPSNKGYRYYLDYILPNQKQQVSLSVRNQIRDVLQKSTLEIQDVFRLSADILSTLTNYTTISFGPEAKSSTISGFRLVRLNPNQVMAILVISNGLVENKVYSIPGSVNDSDLDKVVRIINEELIGLPLDIVIKRLKTDLPILMNRYMNSQIQVVKVISEMMNQFETDRMHVAGRRYLLNYFDSHANVDHLKGIYQLMDDQAKLHQLVTNDNHDIQIRLGSEMDHPLLGDFSFITASYETPTHDTGLIALLGPKNMPYSNVLSIVKGLREELATTIEDYYRNL